MSNVEQSGSRWEVTLAILRCLNANLQQQADAESDRVADRLGELQGTAYVGDGELARIPDVIDITVKMDPHATKIPTRCPAVIIGGGGTTQFGSAAATTGRQSFADTFIEIAIYMTARVLYQGERRILKELELILITGALGQAVISTLRSGGIDSVWSQQAGITVATPSELDIEGYMTNDKEETTAAKAVLSVLVGHESRY